MNTDNTKIQDNIEAVQAPDATSDNSNLSAGEWLRNMNVAIERAEDNNIVKSVVSHKALLNQILYAIKWVNFKEVVKTKIAPWAKDLTLQPIHYLIVVVREFLQLLKFNGWHMGYSNEHYYSYNGSYWKEIHEEIVKNILAKSAEKMGLSIAKVWSPKFQENLIEHFKIESLMLRGYTDTNSEAVLINMYNGTFEITANERKLRDYDADDFLFYQLSFNYDPHATAPMFKAFLDTVLPDKECQTVLAEYMGYVFTRTSTLKLERALLLYGSGANGKSVFYDIMCALFGKSNCSNFTLSGLTDDTGYQRTMIADKLINYCSEISTKHDSERFKVLVSGENIDARLPYLAPALISDYAKLVFNCNSLPRDIEVSQAYFRRLLIIPFNHTIPEEQQDKELAKKIIAAELPGIFNWVLEGLDRLLKQKKFSPCTIADRAVATYNKEADNLQIFIEEFGYKKSDTVYVKLIELHGYYSKFCKRSGLNPLGIVNFGKRLDALKIVRKKMNFGNAVYLAPDPLGIVELLKMMEADKVGK